MPVTIQTVNLQAVSKTVGQKRRFESSEPLADDNTLLGSEKSSQKSNPGGLSPRDQPKDPVVYDRTYCLVCLSASCSTHQCSPIENPLLAEALPEEMPDFKKNGFLAALNPHPHDHTIDFDEPTHTYSVEEWNARRGSIVSVTGFVHHNFHDFNADEVIAKMQKGRRYGPQHPYWGKTSEEIKEEWNKNGAQASSQGTKYHYLLESFYNGNDIGEFSTFKVVGQFLRWHQKHVLHRWVPYRTEMRLKSPREYRTTGTIDALFVVENYPPPAECDGVLEVIMVDWKFSKAIRPTNAYQKGVGRCSHLDDCNKVHYSLQLNSYKWMLERYPAGFLWNGYTYSRVKVVDMMLAVFHDLRSEAEVVVIPDFQDLVSELFEDRKQKLGLVDDSAPT